MRGGAGCCIRTDCISLAITSRMLYSYNVYIVLCILSKKIKKPEK